MRERGQIWTPQPIELEHPLAQGLKIWGMGIPSLTGGPYLFDLLGRNKSAVGGGATWTPAGGNSVGPGILCPSGGSISAPDFTNLAAGDFTVRIVHFPITWPGAFTTFTDKGTIAREFSLFIDTSANLNFAAIGGSNSGTGATGMTPLSTWEFVITRAGTSCSIYVNGVLKLSFSNGGTSAFPSVWSFGGNPSGGGSLYNGIYKEFSFYPYALPQSSIVGLYDERLDGYPTLLRRAPRRSWWLFPLVSPNTATVWLLKA